MHKIILCGLISIALFSACKENETTFVDIKGDATISGTVKADIDQVASQFQSEAVSGYKVTITWNTGDLGVVSDSDNRVESTSVETDENGAYKATVPSTTVGLNYNVVFNALNVDNFKFYEGASETTTTVSFSKQTYNVTAMSGDSIVQNHDFGSFPSSKDVPKLCTIKGNVKAQIEEINTAGTSEAASGVSVRVAWEDADGNDRVITAPTDNNGNYTISLPTTDAGIEFTVSFDEYENNSYSYTSGGSNITGATATYNKSGDFTHTLTPNQNQTQDYDYGAPNTIKNPS